MYAIEFETDIQDGVVKIPDEYQQLKNKHARVVILIADNPEDEGLRMFSNHSAGLVEEWQDAKEDDVWN